MGFYHFVKLHFFGQQHIMVHARDYADARRQAAERGGSGWFLFFTAYEG